MTAFPPPDKPYRADWDKIHVQVAKNETKWWAERMSLAARWKHLRIITKNFKGVPPQSIVVGVIKEPPPRKYSFAYIIGFMHRSDAIDFIRGARAKRKEMKRVAAEKKLELEQTS